MITAEKLTQVQGILIDAESKLSELLEHPVKIKLDVKPVKKESLSALDLAVQTAREYFSVTAALLRGPSRKREIADIRAMCFKALRDYCPHISFRKIGLHFNGRDHSSVIHNINAAIDMIDTNAKYKQDYLAFSALFEFKLLQHG